MPEGGETLRPEGKKKGKGIYSSFKRRNRKKLSAHRNLRQTLPNDDSLGGGHRSNA